MAKPAPQPRVSAPVKKQKKLWIIPIVILSLLLVAAGVVLVKMYQNINVQKANYRVKEANLAARESEIAEIEDNYLEAQSALQISVVLVAITAVCVLIEPLYAKLLKKIKLTAELDGQNIEAIDISDED